MDYSKIPSFRSEDMSETTGAALKNFKAFWVLKSGSSDIKAIFSIRCSFHLLNVII